MPNIRSRPIAIIDSGLGGLTVTRALRNALPAEDLIYFGDTARLPYGTKSASTVCGFVRQIIHFLLPLNPKHVVIACNTATALALPGLAADFPGLPISGVIEPGARAAVAAAGTKRVPVIGVIATEATIRSRAYDRAIMRRRNLARLLLLATPLLVPMIEEGRGNDDPLVAMALEQYLRGMMARKLDVLVLGCTHYPIFKKAIASVVGPKVRLIDSAEQCAQDVARRLRQRNTGRIGAPATQDLSIEAALESPGTLRAFVTDDAARFTMLAARFLDMEISPPTLVDPHALYASPAREAITLRATG
ncbi:MAG: glutamate racemase [Planctomycetota bacterium]|nr:glutamate racemase [Planctomycetota bacterium]